MIEGARASANTSYGMLVYSDIEMWMKHGISLFVYST